MKKFQKREREKRNKTKKVARFDYVVARNVEYWFHGPFKAMTYKGVQ